MDRTRIRWSSLGRVIAGLGAGGILLAVVPGLVEAPDPPSLPADVGLDSGATGAYGYARPAEPPARVRRPAVRDRERSGRSPAAALRRHRPPSRQPETDPAPPERAPATVEAQVPVDPVPASPAPPPPPASPPQPAAADAPDTPPAHQPPAPNAGPSQGASQFGFEH